MFIFYRKERDDILNALLREIRVNQYTKNILIFAAPLFGGVLLDVDILYRSFLAFISFSFIASAVYVINDIMDIEKDRQHPIKRNRPIASGMISIYMAIILAVLLFVVSLGISVYIDKMLMMILLIYFGMNVAYSVRLKHVVLFDVMIIAMGFVLRAFAGVVSSSVGASNWFILCVFMLSLFLALAKRRAEMLLFLEDKSKQRKVLKEYSLELIDQLLMVATAASLTSYSMFALNAHVNSKVHEGGTETPEMLITIPFVIYGMFRYLYLVHIKKQGGAPEQVLVHDKPILITCIMFFSIIFTLRNV